MKLLFKQRLFSWFDSYDIFDETGAVVYVAKGQFAWGHCIKIFDAFENELGTVKQKLFTLLPKFELYYGQQYVGCISREFTFFKPQYNIDCNGWRVEGNVFEWDYQIYAPNGQVVATVTKEFFNWTDTYSMEIYNPQDALQVLMLVLAIDAEKCSRKD